MIRQIIEIKETLTKKLIEYLLEYHVYRNPR